jgi:hypothetical protein
MNKQAKSFKVITGYIFILSFVIFLVYIGIVSAGIIISSTPNLLNSDKMVSPYEDYLNVTINATMSGVGFITNVTANFSSINTTACGTEDGLLNLTYDATAGLWKGNCSVSSFMPIGIYTPRPGNITFFATNNDSETNFTMPGGNRPLEILMHNVGAPNMSASSCMRFGSSTSNFSLEDNWGSVNFTIHVQGNMTCLTRGLINFTNNGFIDFVLVNLTTINLSSQEQMGYVMQMGRVIQINLTQPRSFGDSRIEINTSFFARLNSNATITLYNLPFPSAPNVGADNSTNYNSSTYSWVTNGYEPAMRVITGNLTFKVFGFSGYNVTDNVLPKITINRPSSNNNLTNASNMIFNITVNGTGTQVSYVSMAFNSSLSLLYNASSSTNTANCTNLSEGSEAVGCWINQTLADGRYDVNITVWDFGSTSGNSNSTVRTILINLTTPNFNSVSSSVSSSGATITYNCSKEVNITLSHGTGYDFGTNSTISTYALNGSISLSGLSASTTYYYNITACDSVGNCKVNGTNTFTTSASSTTTTSTSSSGPSTTVSPTIDLNAGYNKLMIVAEQLKFNIGTEQHSLFVQSLINDVLLLKIMSDPQIASFKIGEEKMFELNNDSYYDLYIKFNSVKSGAANLTIQTIHTAIAASGSNLINQTMTPPIPPVANESAEPAEKAISNTGKIIGFIVAVIVIVLVVWYLLSRRQRY